MEKAVIKAAVMVERMKTIQKLAKASIHSMRLDKNAEKRLRDGAELGAGLTWSLLHSDKAIRFSSGSPDRDVLAAYKAHKKKHGVATDNGDLGAHLILSVSALWMDETGSKHGERNSRNLLAFQQGLKWAKTAFGPESVYHGRMNMDEDGGGVIDIFIAPVRVDKRSMKPKISTNKALDEIQARRNRRRSYEALQDDWAEWCSINLDPVIERGTPKVVTKAEHLGVDEYKEAHSLVQAKIDKKLETATEEAEGIRRAAEIKATQEEASQILEWDKIALHRKQVEVAQEEVAEERRQLSAMRTLIERAMVMVEKTLNFLKHLTLTAQEREEARRIVSDLRHSVAKDEYPDGPGQ